MRSIINKKKKVIHYNEDSAVDDAFSISPGFWKKSQTAE
jgi:hypothetical protein